MKTKIKEILEQEIRCDRGNDDNLYIGGIDEAADQVMALFAEDLEKDIEYYGRATGNSDEYVVNLKELKERLSKE